MKETQSWVKPKLNRFVESGFLSRDVWGDLPLWILAAVIQTILLSLLCWKLGVFTWVSR